MLEARKLALVILAIVGQISLKPSLFAQQSRPTANYNDVVEQGLWYLGGYVLEKAILDPLYESAVGNRNVDSVKSAIDSRLSEIEARLNSEKARLNSEIEAHRKLLAEIKQLKSDISSLQTEQEIHERMLVSLRRQSESLSHAIDRLSSEFKLEFKLHATVTERRLGWTERRLGWLDERVDAIARELNMHEDEIRILRQIAERTDRRLKILESTDRIHDLQIRQLEEELVEMRRDYPRWRPDKQSKRLIVEGFDLLVRKGDARRALQAFRYARATDPGNAAASYGMALAYRDLGDAELAEDFVAEGVIKERFKTIHRQDWWRTTLERLQGDPRFWLEARRRDAWYGVFVAGELGVPSIEDVAPRDVREEELLPK